MENIPHSFYARLKKLRLDRGLTIVKVSQDTGISEGALSEYENEKKQKEPSYKKVQILAKYYDVSCDYLFCVTDCEKKENIDIHKILRLSEKAIDRITSHNEMLKMADFGFIDVPGADIAKILNMLLEDDWFCDMFFPNVQAYFDEEACKSALKAIEQVGFLNHVTDSSKIFLNGITEAFTLLKFHKAKLEAKKDKGV